MNINLQKKKEISKKLKEEQYLKVLLCGIASIPGSSRLKLRAKALDRWLAGNHHGEMKWMEAEGEKHKLASGRSKKCIKRRFAYINSQNNSNNHLKVENLVKGKIIIK